MARPVDVATQAVAAAGTGLVSRMSSDFLEGQFTEWLVAGGIGLAGFFGATTQRGMVENISLGAVNGASAYIGVRMADMIQARTAQNGGGQQRYVSYPKPRLVGYGNSAQPASKPTSKSAITI